MIAKLARALGVGVLLVASTATAAVAAQSAPATKEGSSRTVRPLGAADVTYINIQNKANRDCIFSTAGGEVKADGYCRIYTDSEWYVEPLSDGSRRLVNHADGKCAHASGTANNSFIKMWNCGTYLDQKWDLLLESDGYFRLKNRYSGKCMVHRTGDTGPVQQYTCGSYTDQRWHIQ
ncbi:RICIN domain-containing protein [Kribbella sp. NPDC023855]|uniref:RICIN domain-containing protein n=1 Tax=Kribbella sp. NPDC023855 TaxID=3154698 RepID=UPI00340BFF62